MIILQVQCIIWSAKWINQLKVMWNHNSETLIQLFCESNWLWSTQSSSDCCEYPELMTGPNKSVCIYTVSSGSVYRADCLLLHQPSHLTLVTSADCAHSCTSQGHKFPLQLHWSASAAPKPQSRLGYHCRRQPASAEMTHKYWSCRITDKLKPTAQLLHFCALRGKRKAGRKDRGQQREYVSLKEGLGSSHTCGLSFFLS